MHLLCIAPDVVNANSRCRANRARALGWEPKDVTEDMLESIQGAVEWQLKHEPGAGA